MSFAEPQFLYALLAIPLAIVFIAWSWSRRRNALVHLGEPSLIQQLSVAVNWSGRRLRNVLWFVALALLIIALARPQWGSEVETVERQGVQIMIALDVSESMLAEDVRPNRLTRAKLEISDLMRRLSGDEIGLVLFSGASFIQFPLTFDYTTARAFLAGAHPGVISRQGTTIAGAIETALAGFDPDRPGQKVIIIYTDGENHEDDPLIAAQNANQQGAIIYTVGLGLPNGAPIPQYDQNGEVVGYKQDLLGQIVSSHLNETILQQVAIRANGKYFRAGADSAAVEGLAAEISTLQKTPLESELLTRNVERFQGFLIAALVLLAVIEFVPDRVVSRIRFLRWVGETG
jgi:Ca-activated chloride channel family protein